MAQARNKNNEYLSAYFKATVHSALAERIFIKLYVGDNKNFERNGGI